MIKIHSLRRDTVHIVRGNEYDLCIEYATKMRSRSAGAGDQLSFRKDGKLGECVIARLLGIPFIGENLHLDDGGTDFTINGLGVDVKASKRYDKSKDQWFIVCYKNPVHEVKNLRELLRADAYLFLKIEEERPRERIAYLTLRGYLLAGYIEKKCVIEPASQTGRFHFNYAIQDSELRSAHDLF